MTTFKTGDRIVYARLDTEYGGQSVRVGCKATVGSPVYNSRGYLTVVWDKTDPNLHGQMDGGYSAEYFDLVEETTVAKKKFDPTKPVQTRDGNKARIIYTHRNSDYSIVALIGESESNEVYTSSGHYNKSRFDHPLDLVNVPLKVERWLNIWKSPIGEIVAGQLLHLSEKAAQESKGWSNMVLFQTVKVEWEE